MVKCCIVHGCTSGLPSDRKNRVKNNLRQSSLFKVPKNNVLREKWAKALSQQLTPNQCVCEKHFREEDIKKADRIIINGAETIIPRERWTLLNDNVIPINLQDLEMDISEEQVPLVRNDINNCQIENLDCTQPSLQTFEGDDSREDSPSVGLHHMESPEVVTANDVIISELSPPSCVTLEEIHAHFHSVLMQGWCYFAYDEELIFSHINIRTRKEDMNFTIAKNLSVKQVSFSQRPEIAVDDTISSIDDVKNYMETLQATILCEGTGIPYREFASNCTGQVSKNDYKRWRQNPRCLWCRSLRQRLQRKKGIDASKFKVQKVQKAIERFKKRCHRLSRKVIFHNSEELPLNKKISSFSDISNYLKSDEKGPMCVGTQIDGNKYSENCKGVIVCDHIYERYQSDARCEPCQLLRQQLQKCKSTSVGLEGKNDSNVEEKCNSDEEIEKDVTKEIHDLEDFVNEIIIDENVNYTSIKMTKMEMLESLEQRKSEESFLEAEFKCEWCVEVYKNEMERQIHLCKAHAEKPNHTKCDICTTYVRERWFPEHRKDHYLKFQCHFCDFVAYNLLVILRHLKLGHDVRIQPDEMRWLRKRSYLKNPGLKPCSVNVRTNPKKSLEYKCFKCNEVFETKKKRFQHFQQTHKVEHKCSVCGKTFSRSDGLKKHEHIHKGTMPKKVCPICGKSIRHDTISYHMKVHSQREAVVCVPCDKTFVSNTGYQRHLRFSKRHGGDDFRIRCPICLKGFRTNMDRRDHVNYVHKGITIHKCSVCDKVVSSEKLLRRHLRIKHLGEKLIRKSYLCPICGHVCRDSMVLREHESLHTGILTFSCELCDKKFRTFSALYMHKRVFHKVETKQKVVKHIEMDSSKAEE